MHLNVWVEQKHTCEYRAVPWGVLESVGSQEIIATSCVYRLSIWFSALFVRGASPWSRHFFLNDATGTVLLPFVFFSPFFCTCKPAKLVSSHSVCAPRFSRLCSH